MLHFHALYHANRSLRSYMYICTSVYVGKILFLWTTLSKPTLDDCVNCCVHHVHNVHVYMYVGDEVETIINGVRNEVKSAGQQDTRENCWSFFIDRVRKQLKVIKFAAAVYLWSVVIVAEILKGILCKLTHNTYM